MVEPLAVGMHAANKARIRPGDVAVVIGAGPIGVVTALSALAGGCSRVFITDIVEPKLEIAGRYPGITPVNVTKQRLAELVMAATDGWGADIIFEASGSEPAMRGLFEPLCPDGCIVLIGIPAAPIPLDICASQAKEARIESVFRYAHVYPRAINLMEAGKIDVRPLITDKFAFKDSVKAFEFAANMPPTSVKVQIELL